MQRAKEGIGLSVTRESKLYTSDKLKMIRMWDTQGLDFIVSQEFKGFSSKDFSSI